MLAEQEMKEAWKARAPEGPCLSSQELAEVVAGLSTPGRIAAAAEHVASCEDCAEDYRLAAELARGMGLRRSRGLLGRFVLPNAVAAGLVVALAGFFAYRFVSPPATETPEALVKPAAPSTPARPALRIEKPPILVSASDALVMRGAGSNWRRAFLGELAEALEPYRRDDFTEAERRLRTLGAKYPNATELAFYLGVCSLLLDRPAEAIPALRTASAAADEALAGEARFYLALALARSGEREPAAAELRRLCDAGDASSARACRALDDIGLK